LCVKGGIDDELMMMVTTKGYRAPLTAGPADFDGRNSLSAFALPERRGRERLPCPALPEIRYLLRPPMQRGLATLRDLSVQGVGLLLPFGLEPSTALLLQFPGPRRGGATHTQLARVAHAGPHLSGAWLVGCRLTPPLTGEELARLRQLFSGAA
jgi:hypothetical protein